VMVVNGFELPEDFVQLCEAIQRGEAPEEWVLRENVDAYGRPWQNGDLMIYTDPDIMAEETRELDQMYREEDRFQQDDLSRNEAGFADDFTDIANYLRFGTNDAGEVFCFDFGVDPEAPSVVYWDGYWRRVAPNFEAFIALFVDKRKAPSSPDDKDLALGPQPTYRRLVAIDAVSYVMAPPELRSFMDLPTVAYAACSDEDRREVEAEIRELLERRGMTDEQRERLDELWERLRATDQA
jgi:hypothetical protein